MSHIYCKIFSFVHQKHDFKVIDEPRLKKTCLRGFANNKDADQPAPLRILISALVIYLLESIKLKLATNKIALF